MFIMREAWIGGESVSIDRPKSDLTKLEVEDKQMIKKLFSQLRLFDTNGTTTYRSV